MEFCVKRSSSRIPISLVAFLGKNKRAKGCIRVTSTRCLFSARVPFRPQNFARNFKIIAITRRENVACRLLNIPAYFLVSIVRRAPFSPRKRLFVLWPTEQRGRHRGFLEFAKRNKGAIPSVVCWSRDFSLATFTLCFISSKNYNGRKVTCVVNVISRYTATFSFRPFSGRTLFYLNQREF